MNRFNAAVEKLNIVSLVKAHSGMQFFLRDLTLTVDIAQDTILYSTDINNARGDSINSIGWHNSTSVVTRVDYKGKTAIYLGDTHQIAIRLAITPLFSGIYKYAEIVQTAHHGYNDTAANILYKYFQNIEMVLWPVYRNHYDGIDINTGEDKGEGVGEYTDFNGALLKQGIKQVYLRKDICEVCEDFDTWEFKSVDFIK